MIFELPTFQSVTHILHHSDGVLKALSENILSNQELIGLVKKFLPAEFSTQILSANLLRGCLTLTVDYAFAELLRYQTSTLLSQLRQHPKWCGITMIKIQVSHQKKTTATPSVMPVSTASSLPEEGKRTLQALLQNINDPNIKAALQNMIEP